ncbi:MAG TPA: hypothetical protein VEU07_15570, partial [Candidatus Acidoferrum sp.]|nr:hypothetical protein [Candidatus Acidoferrum sp.]
MTRPIALQTIPAAGEDSRITATRRLSLLPGAVLGVETNHYVQGMAAAHSPTRHPSRGQVFLFTRGAGEVRMEGAAFAFSEVAAFFAPGEAPLVIEAASASLEYLEILIDLQEREVSLLHARGPHFVRYDQCEAYSEAIKSPKTVSRTILPA